CEAGLDENEREKAQHTQKYVSIFPVNFRSKMPADGRSRTEPEQLPFLGKIFTRQYVAVSILHIPIFIWIHHTRPAGLINDNGPFCFFPVTMPKASIIKSKPVR